MKTIVYIDGFNLYFGSLQGTPFRWLDLAKLTQRICNEQNPQSEIVTTKYFTADIKAKLSRRGETSYKAQRDYLLALNAHIHNLQIIKGKYTIQESRYHPYGDPVDFDTKHHVWRPEEKQTDVSMAVHLLCDAIDSACDQVVIFSNDSDLSPALAEIKKRTPSIKIGIVAPIRGENRKPSADLKQHADWTRHSIKGEELESSQLPDRVPTRKRLICKPEHWK